MKRREFIILSGIGATSASLLSACGHAEEKLIPALIPDEDFVPGIDYWKVSTCGICAAGCGITVRTREHKANKIEGNPLHPVNRGALCARGQAGLEVLYNPDRIKGPMKRVGERGEGKWEEITWDEAIKTIADKLREIDPTSSTEKPMFFTGDPGSITAHVASHLMKGYRHGFVGEHPRKQITLAEVFADAFPDGANTSEVLIDIANATYLLSLGARFLETWISPVMYSQAYGEFRNSRGKTRGRFVQVEPRMSLTGANADEWIASAPGTKELVALAMAQVIIREGLSKAALSSDAARGLDEFSPEKLAAKIDVPPDRIIRVAREFARAERPLAIGESRSSGVVILNALVANLNKPGGVLLTKRQNPSKAILGVSDDLGPSKLDDRSLSDVPQPMGRSIRLLMIHGYEIQEGGPARSETLKEIPFIISFSPFIDESGLADLILPDHTYLERWDVHKTRGPDGRPVVSVMQPVLAPQLNTRQTADVLLAVARELGGEVSASLPFESARDLIEKSAGDILKEVGAEEVEDPWSHLTETGAAFGASGGILQDVQPSIPLDAILLRAFGENASEVADPGDNPLTLIVYEHAMLGYGTTANLPSLQELPDPLTSVMWGSWLEINPRTAASMGIENGDLVQVTTTNGSLQAPAFLFPAIRPDCVAMPTGQGRSNHGRYARGRGVDPEMLLSSADRQTVRAELKKVGGKAALLRFGTELMEHMETKR